jgi:hypothetical protein
MNAQCLLGIDLKKMYWLPRASVLIWECEIVSCFTTLTLKRIGNIAPTLGAHFPFGSDHCLAKLGTTFLA